MPKALPLEVDLKPGTPPPPVRVSVGRSCLCIFLASCSGHGFPAQASSAPALSMSSIATSLLIHADSDPLKLS